MLDDVAVDEKFGRTVPSVPSHASPVRGRANRGVSVLASFSLVQNVRIWRGTVVAFMARTWSEPVLLSAEIVWQAWLAHGWSRHIQGVWALAKKIRRVVGVEMRV